VASIGYLKAFAHGQARARARARTHPGTRGIGSFILLSRSVRNTRFNFERSRPSRKSELRHAGRYNIYVGNRTLSRKAHDRARTRASPNASVEKKKKEREKAAILFANSGDPGSLLPPLSFLSSTFPFSSFFSSARVCPPLEQILVLSLSLSLELARNFSELSYSLRRVSPFPAPSGSSFFRAVLNRTRPRSVDVAVSSQFAFIEWDKRGWMLRLACLLVQSGPAPR